MVLCVVFVDLRMKSNDRLAMINKIKYLSL